ncbi:hypothetical protein HY488_01105 [Candidatus Woesearchaeota archaeon]|nr:hypothetical protein [Candidatus Woesearchaeota archaeon]
MVKKTIGPDRPFLYHWSCALIILLVIIVLNQVMQTFTSSSEFMQQLRWQNIQKLPGFAIGILTILLIYHILAPLFKWGAPRAGEALGGLRGGGGLPSLPSVGGPQQPPRRWWPPWGRREAAPEQALEATEAAVAQEEVTEAKEEEVVKREELLAEERQRLVQQLASFDMRNIQDTQRMVTSLNELARLAEVYNGNAQALQLIAQRLNEIRPAEADLKANLEEIKKRMVELGETGKTAEKMMLSEADVEQLCKEWIEQENIKGVRNLMSKSMFAELKAAGVNVDRLQQAKQSLIANLLAVHKKLAEPLANYKRNFDLLTGNATVIETAQARFLTSLQAFVNAIQQSVAGQDAAQDALRAIREAQTAFGQLSAALQKNEEYERNIQAALQYESQVDKLEEQLYEKLVQSNKELLAYVEQQREAAKRKQAALQQAAAGLAPQM